MMKKLFTLMTIALVAISVNAKETLESTWNSWGDGCAVEGNTLTFSGAWKGAGFWLADGPDYTQYEKIVIVFSEPAVGKVKFFAQGGTVNPRGDSDPLANGPEAVTVNGDKVIGLTIDPTVEAKYLYQICAQSTEDNCEVKISEIFLGTETEYNEVKESTETKYQEGKSLTFDENGNIWATEFAGYSDDAKVVFTTTVTGSEGYLNWGNGKITSIGEAVQAGTTSVTGDGDNEAVFFLKDLKAALLEPGFYTDGEGNKVSIDAGLNWNVWDFGDGACTSTRKSVVIYEVEGYSGEGFVPTGISTIMMSSGKSDGTIYNLAGQKVSNTYKGLVIKNGKKYIQR
jgi:hypothetical protein